MTWNFHRYFAERDEGLIGAHPETRIFSQFSSASTLGGELIAFKKMKAAKYWQQ